MNISTYHQTKKDIKKIMSSTQDQVLKICFDLFKSTPISFFSYAKMYDTGHMIFFNTDPDSTEKLVSHGYYATLDELNLFHSFGLKTTLMSPKLPLPLGVKASAEKYSGMVSVAAELSLFYRYFVIDRGVDHYRVCGFGTHIEKSSIITFYLNALPMFERFINYFEYQAKEMIEEYNQKDLISLAKYHQKIVVNENADTTFLIPQLSFNVEYDRRADFQSKMFTLREQECLGLIAQGYTMKSAARRLGVSHRTVEQHLRNIKEKFCVNTKNELLDIWYRSRADKMKACEK